MQDHAAVVDDEDTSVVVLAARSATRRRRTRIAAGALAVLVVLLAASTPRPAPAHARAHARADPQPAGRHVDLDQEGVTVDRAQRRRAVPAGLAPYVLPGTHVPDPAAETLAGTLAGTRGRAPVWHPTTTREDALVQAAADRAWLAAGTVPGTGGPYEDLARDALLDLHALDLPGGALVAGWSPAWRYVWPRDAAFGAVALARTGHVDDALAVLGFLTRVQEPDGTFQARYLPDGSGPPDSRGVQLDGTGWALWAAGLVLAQVPADERRDAATALAPLVVRSTEQALRLVAATGLPPASPDYWEVPEDDLTLGTAAPLVAGLQQAPAVLRPAGGTDLARSAAAAARRSEDAVVRTFGAGGFARYASGGLPDAATAFLLPPFWRIPPPGARTAWRASVPEMARPAGGLAPGGGWRDDGVTWTPQTALYAWAAAESDAPTDTALAHRLLRFLDAHRTATGALPEKVLADGSPAAVAPLAWTAAGTLLAIDALAP